MNAKKYHVGHDTRIPLVSVYVSDTVVQNLNRHHNTYETVSRMSEFMKYEKREDSAYVYIRRHLTAVTNLRRLHTRHDTGTPNVSVQGNRQDSEYVYVIRLEHETLYGYNE